MDKAPARGLYSFGMHAGATRGPEARIAIAFALALAATAAVSWAALAGPFLFDDFPNLQHLASLRGALDWASIAHYVSLFEGDPGRPLSMLSFVLNDATWPSQPRSFKYTNLMVHLLVGTVLFGLARTLARARLPGRGADLVAVLAAAAWLLHPMQLSTSMLVIQRMTQLAALFAAAGLWGYAALALRARGTGTAFAAIAALGAGTVLALLCKENGALVPLLAVVANGTLLRDRLAQAPTAARRVLLAGAAAPVVAFVGAIALRWEALTSYGSRDFTMAERLASQARALADYLAQVIVPRLRGGGIYHDDFAVSRGLLEPWTTLPAILFVVALAAAAFALRRRWPVPAFAVGWFLGGHLLESTAFPLELYFEHRNYLPMFGILFALAWGAATAAARWRRIAMAGAVLWLAYATWLTAVQARVWGDAAALATVWAIEHPGSARAVQQHADHVARHGDPREAAGLLLDAYARGVRGGAFPLQALAIACGTGDARVARSASPYLRGLREDAYGADTLSTVSALRREVQHGRCPTVLDDAGWLAVTDALLDNPRFVAANAGAYLHVERAYLFRHRRRLGPTMRELEAAWAVRPSAGLALLGATTLASAGLDEQAIAWARKGLAATPRGVRGMLSRDEERLRQVLQLLEARHGGAPHG